MTEPQQIEPQVPPKMFSPIIIGLGILLIALIGIVLMRSNIMNNDNATVNPPDEAAASETPTPVVEPQSPTPATDTPSTPVNESPVASADVSNVKTFTIIGSNFAFSPTEMKVRVGDTVKVIFNNNEGKHDWVIDEFNAKTDRILANQTAEVQFVANKAGTFEYYCSVGEHRKMGMVGKLIVE